jgi:hypothetical protein
MSKNPFSGAAPIYVNPFSSESANTSFNPMSFADEIDLGFIPQAQPKTAVSGSADAGGGQQGGGMPMSAATMAMGGLQIAGGLYGMSRLGKRPTFQIGDDILSAKERSARMAEMGFTPEQKSQFEQQMARTTNTMETRAREMGGGSLGKAISGMKSYQQLGALNNFAAQDAARMMENIRYDDKMAMYIQGEKNRATADAIRNYEMLASLYGGAVSKGFENMIGGINYNQAIKMLGASKGVPL